MISNLKKLMNNTCKKITPEKALAIMEKDKDVIIIDVRSRQEFEGKHLPSSINIPLDHIESIQERVTDKNRKIIIYSNGTVRASKACDRLKSFGYEDTVILSGLNEWPY